MLNSIPRRAMVETLRIVYMPNGLELAVSRTTGGLRLSSYKWRVQRSGLSMESITPETPRDVLRSARFRTIEDLVDALQRELGTQPDWSSAVASAGDSGPGDRFDMGCASEIAEDDPSRRVERRRDAREPIEEGRFEPLWVICKAGTIGGHAVVRDLSTRGMKIGVDRRAWRLVAALEQSSALGATVEVFRIPRDRHGKARVVWVVRDAADEVSFGLELTEPLASTV